MQGVALVASKKDMAFLLAVERMTFTEFALMFDRINRPSKMQFFWESYDYGATCRMKCCSVNDFEQMYKELKREIASA